MGTLLVRPYHFCPRRNIHDREYFCKKIQSVISFYISLYIKRDKGVKIMPDLKSLQKETRNMADPKRAKVNAWFFKSGPGQYGEGDKHLGLSSPQTHWMAKKYHDLSLAELKKLIASKYHEERLIALRILVLQFQTGKQKEKSRIYKFYLANSKNINNWDLIDASADKIVGQYLLDNPSEKPILKKLAKSDNLWQRRIAIIATYQFIKNDKLSETLQIAKLLLTDKHDLIHKAVGWMLREVGKKDLEIEEKFLQKHYQAMPRTALRYAIEKFPEPKRQKYLKFKVDKKS
jgi:3-methyladenine DNA glycosylase AlkD